MTLLIDFHWGSQCHPTNCLLYGCASLNVHVCVCSWCVQVHYLQDFASKLKLNIQYGTEIKKLSRWEEGSQLFKLLDQHGVVHICRTVVVWYETLPYRPPSSSPFCAPFLLALFFCIIPFPSIFRPHPSPPCPPPLSNPNS